MAEIFPTFFKSILLHKNYFKCRCNLFLRIPLIIRQIDSDNGLAPERRQTIIWTNDDLPYRLIDASCGLSEFISTSQSAMIARDLAGHIKQFGYVTSRTMSIQYIRIVPLYENSRKPYSSLFWFQYLNCLNLRDKFWQPNLKHDLLLSYNFVSLNQFLSIPS